MWRGVEVEWIYVEWFEGLTSRHLLSTIMQRLPLHPCQNVAEARHTDIYKYNACSWLSISHSMCSQYDELYSASSGDDAARAGV